MKIKKIILLVLITSILTNLNLNSYAYENNDFKNEIIKQNSVNINLASFEFNSKEINFINNLESEKVINNNVNNQVLYTVLGIPLGAILGTACIFGLTFVLSSIASSLFPGPQQSGLAVGYIGAMLIPAGALVGGIYGGIKGNELALEEIKSNRK
ncbi:MAG: hypothetical protein U0457_00035 [Candidatus Sericytochromatia bacterium]